MTYKDPDKQREAIRRNAAELLQATAELLKAEAQSLRNTAVRLKNLVSKGE